MAPALDIAATLERFDQDRQLLDELAELFLQNYPQVVEQLRAAVSQHKVALVQQYAHALKGSISNFCAPRAEDKARRLETLARTGDLTGIDEALAELTDELALLSAEFKRLLA